MSYDGILLHSQDPKEKFTEEALQSQDGKKVPLRLETDGPIVGEATLKYDSEEKTLKAEFRVDDPIVAELLRANSPIIIKKESY